MDGIDVGEKVTRQIVRSLGIGICILRVKWEIGREANGSCKFDCF